MSRARAFQGVRESADARITTEAAMTFDEIARKTGMSKQMVWYHYSNAIRKLRRNRAIRQIRELAQMRECNG